MGAAQLNKMQKKKKKKTLLEFRIGLLSVGGNIRPAVERWGTLSPPQSHFYPLRCEARCNARDLVSSKWQPLMLAKALKCQKKKKKKKSWLVGIPNAFLEFLTSWKSLNKNVNESSCTRRCMLI